MSDSNKGQSNQDDTTFPGHPIFDSMMGDFFRDPTTLAEATMQMAAMRHALLSVMQDMAVMKQALKEAGTLGDERYKQLRMRRMLEDHSSAGSTPWEGHSYYPHLQDQSRFLAQSLRCTSAEIAEFEQQVEHAQTLT
jgi:hypothetical protein